MKLIINEKKEYCQVLSFDVKSKILSLRILEKDDDKNILNIEVSDFGRKICKPSKNTQYYDSTGILRNAAIMVFHDKEKNEYILRTSNGDEDESVLHLLEARMMTTPDMSVKFYYS